MIRNFVFYVIARNKYCWEAVAEAKEKTSICLRRFEEAELVNCSEDLLHITHNTYIYTQGL